MPVRTFMQKLGFTLLLSTAAQGHATGPSAWDWRGSPSTQDWRSFFKASPENQAKYWQSLEKSKTSFESIAWEWRLGFVRVCASSQEAWCGRVLQMGLFDRALVVRAEAASRLGERFAGTGHPGTLRLLSTAFAVQQNRRGDRPLYIQYRILHAIRQIGGKEGLHLGERLALSSDETSRYWQLLATR